MKLTVMPFQSVLAFADIDTGEIFISRHSLDGTTIKQDLKHEIAHVLSQSADHDNCFNDYLVDQLGGEPVIGHDLLKCWRKATGIPTNIAGNIGNISGIQNMLLDYHLLQSYRKFCVSDDTLIWTPEGRKPVCKIKRGDQVLTANQHTGTVEPKTVTEVFDNGELDCFTVSSGNNQLTITPNHRLFSDRGLKQANQLSVDDALRHINKRGTIIADLLRIDNISLVGKRRVIDLCVPPYHTYLVGEGLLSHNSQKILGTEGHWEVINEGGEGPANQLIRLYPTPKGVFPVVVLYYPVVTHFRSPQAKKLVCDATLAQAKLMLGHARRKIKDMPNSGGGNIGMDGAELITEGNEMMEKLTQQAIDMGEPNPIIML